MKGPDPDRVVQIFAGKKVASGYVARSGVVITAAHSVEGAEPSYVVGFRSDHSQWETTVASVAVRSEAADLAILLCETPPGIADEPVEFGQVERGGADRLPCTGTGFPRFMLRENAANASLGRESHDFHGWVSGKGLRTGDLTIATEVDPPEPDPKACPWGGVSGSAVFADGRVIGLVKDHHHQQGPQLTLSTVGEWYGQLSPAELALVAALLDLPASAEELSVCRPKTGHPDRPVPIENVSWPLGLRNIPFHPSTFVGRARELRLLGERLADASAVVVQAVYGLGGIGKSTLVAHWIAKHADPDHPVWWITADSPAGVAAGLTSLGAELRVGSAQTLESEHLRGQALRWLATHQNWLVVLDNVNNPADVEYLLANLTTGRFVITSRLSQGWAAAESVRLDVLSSSEAMDLFTRIASGNGPRTTDGVADLCAELGCLPLAVEQSAAYCATTGIAARTYLEMLAEHAAAMFETPGTLFGEEADSEKRARRTTARIWSITLDRLAGDPLAGRILRILAWYAPDNIPRFLIDDLGTPPEVNTALGRLAAYSMVTLDSETATIAVHRLVQAVARTPDTGTPGDPHRRAEDIKSASEEAAEQLRRVPIGAHQDPATWALRRTVLPHTEALLSHIPTGTENTSYLHNELGAFLRGQGDLTRAIAHLGIAVVDRIRVLGADHRDTLISRNNLAGAYELAGDLERALPMYEGTLADSIRVLGEDHPDTLGSRNNLAGAYELAGDLERALPMYEGTLADSIRVLGEDHPNTLTTRNNLAYAYQSSGDLERAIPMYEGALADSIRALGEDHPNTLGSRHNLAYAYQSAGDPARAIPLYEQTLADRIRVLGEEHPDTFISRNNLAYAYQLGGGPARAIPLFEQTLADRIRVLGEEHPDTLSIRSNLAAAYQSAGDPARAISLFEQVLTDSVRVLGEEHPDTFISRNNLAGAHELAGDLARAIPLYEQTLADSARVLGDDHPTTQIFRNNLKHARKS